VNTGYDSGNDVNKDLKYAYELFLLVAQKRQG